MSRLDEIRGRLAQPWFQDQNGCPRPPLALTAHAPQDLALLLRAFELACESEEVEAMHQRQRTGGLEARMNAWVNLAQQEMQQ